MARPENRARYWARSFAGWQQFSSVRCNAAHEGLARLQRLGWVGPIVTQNVDRLHQQAGARDVIELHGTTHRCGRAR
jgi:NAD+-dependent protein deacetylase sirtuin 4